MEVHQFIGDLITSGNALQDQPDVLNAAWGVAAGGVGGVEALRFKGASLEPLQQLRPVRDKSEAEPGRRIQPGTAHRKGQARDKRPGQRSKYERFAPIVLLRSFGRNLHFFHV